MQAGRCLRQHSVRCTYAVVCLASRWACKELRTEDLHAMRFCTPLRQKCKSEPSALHPTASKTPGSPPNRAGCQMLTHVGRRRSAAPTAPADPQHPQ